MFTRAFLPLLPADLPLLDAIKTAQERVYALARTADYDQTPAYYDEVRERACLSRECEEPNAIPASSASDDALAAMIDAQTSPDLLVGMLAKLPEGPLKKRAKKELAALREAHAADLSVAPPVPAPTKSPAVRSYKWPEGAQLVPQLDHSSLVLFVLFSPDGARIASGSWDKSIKLWDAASGRLLRMPVTIFGLIDRGDIFSGVLPGHADDDPGRRHARAADRSGAHAVPGGGVAINRTDSIDLSALSECGNEQALASGIRAGRRCSDWRRDAEIPVSTQRAREPHDLSASTFRRRRRMQITKFVLAATLALVTTLARAAGTKAIEVPADSSGPALRAFVWSPCAAPAADIRVG